MVTEVLPATFPTERAAEVWATHLDIHKVQVVEVIPSKEKRGRYQVKVRRP